MRFGAGVCGLGWDSRLAVCTCCLEVAIRGWGGWGAVWGGRKFTVLAGVCGLDAMTWLAVCDLALRAV